MPPGTSRCPSARIAPAGLETPQAAQSSAGIQTLLEAEKEAAKIVQKARQCGFLVKLHFGPYRRPFADRVQRLKDARTEAAKDIESLKALKQSEFQSFEKSYLGSSDESVAKVTADTDVQLKTVEATFAKNKGKVLEKIMEQVVKVNPEVHINAFAPKSYA